MLLLFDCSCLHIYTSTTAVVKIRSSIRIPPVTTLKIHPSMSTEKLLLIQTFQKLVHYLVQLPVNHRAVQCGQGHRCRWMSLSVQCIGLFHCMLPLNTHWYQSHTTDQCNQSHTSIQMSWAYLNMYLFHYNWLQYICWVRLHSFDLYSQACIDTWIHLLGPDTFLC